MADVSDAVGRRARTRACAARSASARDATRSSCRSIRRPSGWSRELTADGARLVSLNPLRDTLEDFFVKQVSTPEAQAPRRGLDRSRDKMSATAAIALNVFRESVRDKVLYNLVLFAILLIGASYLIGQLTAGQDVKIIKDLGLSATSVFGLFIAVFIGIGLVSKEVERRSVYSLLAKPIHRYQMIAGKYAGLTLTLAVNVAIMAAALYAVLAYMPWGVPATCSRPGTRRRSIRRC